MAGVSRTDYLAELQPDHRVVVSLSGGLTADLQLLPDGTVRGKWQSVKLAGRGGRTMVPEQNDPRWVDHVLLGQMYPGDANKGMRNLLARVVNGLYAAARHAGSNVYRSMFWSELRTDDLPGYGNSRISWSDLELLMQESRFATEFMEVRNLGQTTYDALVAAAPVFRAHLRK